MSMYEVIRDSALHDNRAIRFRDLLKSSNLIDIISIESGGRNLAEKMIKSVKNKNKYGNLIQIRPSRRLKDDQTIEWVEGKIKPERISLICDDLIATGGTMKTILNYLFDQRCKPENLYVSVEQDERRFFWHGLYAKGFKLVYYKKRSKH